MFVLDYLLAIKNSKLDRHAIRNLQFRKLRNILNADTQSAADIKKLLDDHPATDKSEVMQNLPSVVEKHGITLDEIREYIDNYSPSRSLLKNKYIVSSTSGTSGNKGYFINTVDRLNKCKAILVARNIRSNFTTWDFIYHLFGLRFRISMISPNDGPYISSQVMSFQPKIVFFILKTQNLSIFSPIEQLVSQLNKFQPHYLHAYPSVLEQLAIQQLDGRLKIKPKVVSTSSEPLTKTVRALTKKAFKLRSVSNSYSSTECLAMASECEYENMHVNSDCAILEPYTNSGTYKEGELSDGVLVTNLNNDKQPVVKYKLDDRIRFTGKTCKCGSIFPVIELEGRTDDTIWLKTTAGGYIPFTPIPLEIIMLDFEEIYLYKITHIEQNHILVNIDKADNLKLSQQVKKRLLDHFIQGGVDSTVDIAIEEYRSNASKRPKKVKQIENLVAIPKTVCIDTNGERFIR